MKTVICETLGIEFPILAFTHCRDVAAAVSKAGGLGVLGIAGNTPDDIEVELVRHDPGLAEPDLALFGMLAGVLRELDPDGIPMPLLQGGVTDGRFFAQLGIQTYGFMPMRLPPDFPVLKVVHAADERIPVAALEFGTEAVTRALHRF